MVIVILTFSTHIIKIIMFKSFFNLNLFWKLENNKN